MSASKSTIAQPAMFAGQQCMPFSMHHMYTSNSMLMRTGVLASVSLFVLLHTSYTLLLIGLVLLISLILIGLTGFGGLVGLLERLAQAAAQGD